MEIQNRTKIKKFSDGYVIEITDKQWFKVGNYKTPCFIQYRNLTFELHNDYLIQYQNENEYIYQGKELEQILPRLLEEGSLLPRDENNNPIFNLTKKEK